MQNGQQNKHLSWFKVENFKCFEAFEMEDIGQFNLIFGDNNTGKTTVLEALLFDDENFNQFLVNLTFTLQVRGMGHIQDGENILNIQYLKQLYNNHLATKKSIFSFKNHQTKNQTITIEPINISALDSKGLSEYLKHVLPTAEPQKDLMLFTKGKEGALMSIYAENNRIEANDYAPYVPFNTGYSYDLVKFFSDIQQSKSAKKNLINNLKTFIPNIEDIEITMDEFNYPFIGIFVNDSDRSIPFSMFGDGAKKLFRILVELPMCKHHRLMIDEIDTGIHYSRFKDFWKTILVAAKENDVQIFATTHNKDGLRYFYEALEELPEYQQDARCFTLSRIKDNSVKAYTQTYEQFEHALLHDIEIRGRQ